MFLFQNDSIFMQLKFNEKLIDRKLTAKKWFVNLLFENLKTNKRGRCEF